MSGRLLLALGLAALLARPGLLSGVLSAEDHLSVHHVFQETPGGRVHNPAMSDPAVQFKALRRRVVQSWRQGQVPLWNPDLYGGAPLWADAQSAPLGVATLLRVPPFVPDGVAANAAALWGMVWLGLGAAGLGRALGLGAGAAAVVGGAALVGPFVQVWLLHPHAATYAWWPWLWWWVERLRAGASPLWGAAVVVGLFAGGHPETAAQGLVLAALWALVRLRGGAAWARLGVGLGAGVLLAAPLWAPVLEQVLGSATAQAHGGNRLHPAQLLDLLWPNLRGHPATEAGVQGPGVWADGVLHPGLGALVLALRALRTRAGRWLWAGWALCLLLALSGLGAPLNNSRLGGAGALLLALAAGHGVPALGPRALAALWLGVVLSGAWARRLDHQAVPWAAHDPAPAPWAQALAARVGDGKVVGLGWAAQPNTASLADLRDLRGYDLPVSVHTERLMRALDPRVARPWFPLQALSARNLRVLRFAGVRAVLAPADATPDPLLASAEEWALGPSPVRIWALEPSAPRAWLALGAWPAPDPDAALEAVASGRADRARPPVEGLEAPLGGQGLVPVTVQEAGAARALALPPREAPAVLVLTERWDAGWRVAVDGQPRPALRVGGAWLGVVVRPTDAEARWVYRPAGWVAGGWLAVVGVGVLLGWGGWVRVLRAVERRNVLPQSRP